MVVHTDTKSDSDGPGKREYKRLQNTDAVWSPGPWKQGTDEDQEHHSEISSQHQA
jgi:hypothetical protein